MATNKRFLDGEGRHVPKDQNLEELLTLIGPGTENVIILHNTGMTYGDLNEKSLRFASRFKDLRLVINGGHYAGDITASQEIPANERVKIAAENPLVMAGAEKIFDDRGLVYQKFSYFPNVNDPLGGTVYIAHPPDNAQMSPSEDRAMNRELQDINESEMDSITSQFAQRSGSSNFVMDNGFTLGHRTYSFGTVADGDLYRLGPLMFITFRKHLGREILKSKVVLKI